MTDATFLGVPYSALNCGECLTEHVNAIKLRGDGSCPCCEHKHDLVTWNSQTGKTRCIRTWVNQTKVSETRILWVHDDGSIGGSAWVPSAELTQGW